MKRLDLIDGLRGYFLVGMFLTHAPGAEPLLWAHHSQFSFDKDATGFVFLSGLMVGLIYGQRMIEHGFAAGAWALWRRAAKLYSWIIGCILAILLIREILPGAAEAWNWSDAIGPLAEGRAGFILAAALLLSLPCYLDILPQYFVYMLVAAPLLWLCLTKRWLWVAAASATLWFAVQMGVFRPFADVVDHSLSSLDPDLRLRVLFNVFGWQAIFFGAMVIGALCAQGKIEFNRIFDPHKTLLVETCTVLLFFFLLMRLGFTDPMGIVKHSNRSELSLVYLVNFVLLVYFVAWLLIAGPRSKHEPTATIGRALTWLFSLSFLRLLGRHSLLVYAWHVVLVYLIWWWDWAVGPLGKMPATATAICGVALLALPAMYKESHPYVKVPSTRFGTSR